MRSDTRVHGAGPVSAYSSIRNQPSIALHIKQQNESLAEHGQLCLVIIQYLQSAPPIILDEIAEISLEALEESSDSNVRLCLGIAWDAGRRKANVQIVVRRPRFGQGRVMRTGGSPHNDRSGHGYRVHQIRCS